MMKTDTVASQYIAIGGASAPRPVWERQQLFQEPVYAEGVTLLEDDNEDDDTEG